MFLDLEDREKVYADAIGWYGRDHQMIVALEELSELAKEICKAYRYHKNRDAVIEEIADTIVTCEQLCMIFDAKTEVREMMAHKVHRLARTIENEKIVQGWDNVPDVDKNYEIIKDLIE